MADKYDFDFVADLRIDPDHLEKECISQTELYLKYAGPAAEAQLAMDRAKRRLEVVKAGVDFELRQDPAAFGITGKVTEAAISNALTLHPTVEKAEAEFIEKKYQHQVLRDATSAVFMRKDMLQELIRLFAMGYYSDVKAVQIDEDTKKVYDKKLADTGEELANRKLNRKG